MTIDLPIELSLDRPVERPDSPFGECGRCEYVRPDLRKCPGCGIDLPTGGNPWPRLKFIELWDDVVFAYNAERPEIAAVVSAEYFEASMFDLIYWGTVWLDPELNWIGAAFEEVRQKEERIWKHLDTIRGRSATDKALQQIFSATGKQMLQKALGADAQPFWEDYCRLAGLRNNIVHRGLRLRYRTVSIEQDGTAAHQTLIASIHFVPTCWVVFSRLWNEYIHPPMLERAKREGKC